MIVEDEQQGKNRAEYGKKTLQELSKRLTKKFGKGFPSDNLGSTIICTEIHFKPPSLKDTKKLKYSISITWRLCALVAYFNPVLIIEEP